MLQGGENGIDTIHGKEAKMRGESGNKVCKFSYIL